MEDAAIREGFRDLKPGTAYDNLYEAALCRERADWIVGMNATRLFYACILQAVSDYRAAKKARNKREQAEVLRFFHSQWFGVLTEIDPEYLIRRLDEEG